MFEIHHIKLCLSLICLSSMTLSPGFFMPGLVEPDLRQYKLQEGQRLELWCFLTNERQRDSCNASDMSIGLSAPQNTCHVVGTQTPTAEYNVSMVIEKTTTNESGIYYCYCHNTAMSFFKAIVTIQAPPVEPENITIILDNFVTLLVGFNPVRNSTSLNADTTWSLRISAFDKSNSTTCEASNDEYWCKIESTWSFRSVLVNVTIEASNEIGSSSTRKEVRLYHCVKPRPMDVHAEGNRTWVDLTWTLPAQLKETFYFGGLDYELVFSSQLFPPREVNRTCLSRDYREQEKCEKMETRVEGLYPDTTYNVTLRSRPVEGGYWSAPANFTFSTLEDVPRAGPEIHPWLYTTVRQGNWMTLIYPQEVKPQERAGNIIAYEYRVEGMESNKRKQGIPHWLPVNSYAPNGPALTVRLWACTLVGCSQNFSSIALPGSLSNVPKPSWLDVEIVNASFYRLFWEDLALQPSSSSLQLHWCWGRLESLGQSSLVFCKTKMSSREVGNTASSALQRVSPTEDPCSGEEDCSVQFGISVERDGASSGIVWNTCIFRHGLKPEKVSGVYIERRKAPKELTLTWNYPCYATSTDLQLHGRPFKFESRLRLNTTTCDDMQGPSQTSEAVHGENRHHFKDLQSGKAYLICVRSLSLPSQPWQNADWTRMSELPFLTDSTLEVELGISLSICAFVLVIIVIALYLVRRKYKEKKLPINTDFLREGRNDWPVPVIAVPECEDLPQWTPPIQQQVSVVSGTETSPETVTASCPPEDPQTDRSKCASESDYHFQLDFPEGSDSTGQQMETPDSNHSSTRYKYNNIAFDADMEDGVNGSAGTKEEETTASEVKKGKALTEPSRPQEGGLTWDMTNGVVSFDSSGKSSSDHDPHYIRSGHRLSGGFVDVECSHPSVV